MKNHYEVLSARKYYGRHATGTVLLVNGSVEFHGKHRDIKKILKKNRGVERKVQTK